MPDLCQVLEKLLGPRVLIADQAGLAALPAGQTGILCQDVTVTSAISVADAHLIIPEEYTIMQGGGGSLDFSASLETEGQAFQGFLPGEVTGTFGGTWFREAGWWGAKPLLDPSQWATAPDSGVAIQSALDSAPTIATLSSSPYAVVAQYRGPLKVARPIRVPNFSRLRGENERSSVLFFNDTTLNDGEFVINMGSVANDWNFDMRLRDVHLVLQNGATKTIHGVDMTGGIGGLKGEGTRLDHIRFNNFTGTGIELGSTAAIGVDIHHIHFTQSNNSSAGQIGININGGGQNLDIRHVTINGDTAAKRTAGIRVRHTTGVEIGHVNLEDCVDGILLLTNVASGNQAVTLKNILASSGTGAGNSTTNIIHISDVHASAKYDITNVLAQGGAPANLILDDGAVSGPGAGAGFTKFKYVRIGSTMVTNA